MTSLPVLHREPAYATTRPYPGYEANLSPEACGFLVRLHEEFADRVREILQARTERQTRLNAGEMPDFLPETRHIREAVWRVPPVPEDLRDRRVEITGPVDRKTVINALNSGAKVYMADFEDAHSPTWEGTLAGQLNIRDAVRRRIAWVSAEGKHYRLNRQIATLMVRPRGWHLTEKHFLVHGVRMPAALFDVGLFLFFNSLYLLDRGSGPYLYLPKLENHQEARLWNDIFLFSEDVLRIPRGSIKATVLIETILAVFEMHEILYELREHVTGLNCGRWDYIFSFIKKLCTRPEFVLPDRAQLTMQTHFLRTYSRLLIQTCHQRAAYALGGMAAQIPIRNDPEANARAVEKVRADKEREAEDGHDGTWVAHPDLVPVAMEVFDRHMPEPNQLRSVQANLCVTAADLLQVPKGQITEASVANNVHAALHYIACWLGGRGAVPINGLMEDAATAEIARAQLWQWIRHPAGMFEDGRRVTLEIFRNALSVELARRRELPTPGIVTDESYRAAAELLKNIVENPAFEEFLTVPAYERLP
jgi:malate synthase